MQRPVGRLDLPGTIKAAIGALHVQAQDHASTDWRQMLLLYSALLPHEPTDAVRLNRAAVLAETGALAETLAETERLAGSLEHYQPFQAARADLLQRAGDGRAAGLAYRLAIELSETDAQRRFLSRYLAKLGPQRAGFLEEPGAVRSPYRPSLSAIKPARFTRSSDCPSRSTCKVSGATD